MCCFSAAAAIRPSFWRRLLSRGGTVHVAKTRIFARRRGDLQTLVYAMQLTAAREVAMILPLPVALPTDDDAVRFVDLSDHPDFFDRLERCFWVDPPLSRSSKGVRFAPQSLPRLVVHRVGAFDASYVPGAAHFDRLDPRFRLPGGFLDALPQYADHGFAVFQLAAGRNKHIQPMAFHFPPRDAERLFFPTVHVHDGAVHADARFDHTLYWQGPEPDPSQSDRTAPKSVDLEFRTVPIEVLDPDAPLHARTLTGRLPNADTWVG